MMVLGLALVDLHPIDMSYTPTRYKHDSAPQAKDIMMAHAHAAYKKGQFECYASSWPFSNFIRIKTCLEQHELLARQLENIMSQVESLLERVPGPAEMPKPEHTGVGITTLAGFLAETGDLSNYNHGQQIIRRAGEEKSMGLPNESGHVPSVRNEAAYIPNFRYFFVSYIFYNYDYSYGLRRRKAWG